MIGLVVFAVYLARQNGECLCKKKQREEEYIEGIPESEYKGKFELRFDDDMERVHTDDLSIGPNDFTPEGIHSSDRILSYREAKFYEENTSTPY